MAYDLGPQKLKLTYQRLFQVPTWDNSSLVPIYWGDGTTTHLSISPTLLSTSGNFSGGGSGLTGIPQSGVTGLTSALGLLAPLASPTLTGTPLAPTASFGTNTTQIATTSFVSTAVATAVTGLLHLQGNLDCSGNPNYPSAIKGDLYYVSVAGKIGGASGTTVDIGDAIVCKADNAGGTQASVGTSWFILEHNLVGALLATNNLSDLTNVSSARTNLGLGTLATLNSISVPTNITATGTPNSTTFLRGDGAWTVVTAPPVLSVFGRIGDVVATIGDYSFSQISGLVSLAQGGTGVDNSTGGTANQFWARPNGATGAVSYRAIVAADIPTLNQNTSGSAATLTTPRAINGVNFDGSAAITVPLPLTRTAVKTGNYTASAGDLVPCDSTSGAFIVTLPTAPADKTIIGVKHIIQGGTNTITIVTGGSDVYNKVGGSTSGTLSLLSQGYIFQYQSSTAIWTIIADDITLPSMDLRFSPLVGSSSLVTTGTLTSGSTGAGFTVALSTSTITGTLVDARLSANVPLLNAANTFSAVNTFGVGISSPRTISNNNEIFGAGNVGSMTSGTGQNTIVGQGCALVMTTGFSNVIVGQGIFPSILTTGANNVAIGQGITTTDANCNRAVAIGGTSKAGSTAIAIGYGADATNSGSGANVAIGFGATATGVRAISLGLNAVNAANRSCMVAASTPPTNPDGSFFWYSETADPSFLFGRASSTSPRMIGGMRGSWSTSTDATRQASLMLGVYGNVSTVETFQAGLTITAQSSGLPLVALPSATITAGSASVVGLDVVGNSSPSVDIFQVHKGATKSVWVTSSGVLANTNQEIYGAGGATILMAYGVSASGVKLQSTYGINWSNGTGGVFSDTNDTSLTRSTNGGVLVGTVAGTGTKDPALTITPGAHTVLTASTEYVDLNFNLARTLQFATGALATQRSVRIQAPTLAAVAASTITTAATVDVSGAPIAGTNATITNGIAARIAAGYSGAKALQLIMGGSGSSNSAFEILKSDGTTVALRFKDNLALEIPTGGLVATDLITDGSGNRVKLNLNNGVAGTFRQHNAATALGGSIYQMAGLSSTSTERVQGELRSSWSTSTDATRQASLVLGAYGIVSSAETFQQGLTITATSSGAPSVTVNGGLLTAPSELLFGIGANTLYALQSGGFNLGSGRFYGWSASTGPSGTSVDTAFSRNAAGIVEANNGTPGSYRDLKLRNLITNPTIVASLTAAATAGASARSFVTDSMVTHTLGVGTAVVGGGTNKVPCYSDGTQWLIG